MFEPKDIGLNLQDGGRVVIVPVVMCVIVALGLIVWGVGAIALDIVRTAALVVQQHWGK